MPRYERSGEKRINQALEIVRAKKKITNSLKWASTYGENGGQEGR